jgi:hypothetical protein
MIPAEMGPDMPSVRLEISQPLDVIFCLKAPEFVP